MQMASAFPMKSLGTIPERAAFSAKRSISSQLFRWTGDGRDCRASIVSIRLRTSLSILASSCISALASSRVMPRSAATRVICFELVVMSFCPDRKGWKGIAQFPSFHRDASLEGTKDRSAVWLTLDPYVNVGCRVLVRCDRRWLTFSDRRREIRQFHLRLSQSVHQRESRGSHGIVTSRITRFAGLHFFDLQGCRIRHGFCVSGRA